MKALINIPLAVIATALVPKYMEKDPVEEIISMRQAIAEREIQIEEFRSLQKRMQAGEKIELKLTVQPLGETSQFELQKKWQQVTDLREKYEELKTRLNIVEPPKLDKSTSGEEVEEKVTSKPLRIPCIVLIVESLATPCSG